MATKIKAVEIVEIPDDDNNHVPVAIPGDPTKQPAMGANKEKAILVESYCESMEARKSKKREFSELNRASHVTQYEDVLVLDSFLFQDQNLRRKMSINSNFEVGESSNMRSGSVFVCGICVDEKRYNESFSINGCTHSYCTDCVCKYIVSKLEDNVTQIRCPVSGCMGLLEPEDCRLILPREVFDRWGKALCEAVILESHKFYCPYKDCSAMLINDGGMGVALSNCQYCERDFCAQCKVPWHLGMDCREFQSLNKDEKEAEDVMLMQLAKNSKWTRCPKCRFYVEKFTGCNSVQCRCGYSFCYTCGNLVAGCECFSKIYQQRLQQMNHQYHPPQPHLNATFTAQPTDWYVPSGNHQTLLSNVGRGTSSSHVHGSHIQQINNSQYQTPQQVLNTQQINHQYYPPQPHLNAQHPNYLMSNDGRGMSSSPPQSHMHQVTNSETQLRPSATYDELLKEWHQLFSEFN